MPGEVEVLILFTFEVVKFSPIHIWKPFHTFHSKVKAFPSEPSPYLLQAVTKNKYTIQFLWMACISRFATPISTSETELALGTIRVNDINRITASEIKLMRATAGYTRWDHKRNEDVLRELQLESVVHFINNYQLNWKNHVHRTQKPCFITAHLGRDPWVVQRRDGLKMWHWDRNGPLGLILEWKKMMMPNYNIGRC